MTIDEINNEFAKLDGWKELPNEGGVMLPYDFYNTRTKQFTTSLPIYTLDLNAVHAAEDRIIGNHDIPSANYWVQYISALVDEAGAAMFRATALQRCRAMLKVRGVWKE